MNLLDGGLIALVLIVLAGILAALWRLLAEEDGDGHPDRSRPQWSPGPGRRSGHQGRRP